MKKIIGIFIHILLINTVLPVSGTILNEISEMEKSSNAIGENIDFNLEAWIESSRKFFSHIYSSFIINHIVFIAGVKNKESEVSTGGTVEFEIIKIFGKDTGQYYNETWDFGPIEPNKGRGKVLTCFLNNKVGKIGVFIAKTTIKINDSNPDDNIKSFIFILID